MIGELPNGVGPVRVVAVCDSDASEVLARAREVLDCVVRFEPWPDDGMLRAILPAWFVDACAPEQTLAEAQEWLIIWRALPPGDQRRASADRPWSLADWLYWMNPEERQWSWWDAEVESEDRLRVAVDVAGWPTAVGSLVWLLRAAGAIAVEQP